MVQDTGLRVGSAADQLCELGEATHALRASAVSSAQGAQSVATLTPLSCRTNRV